MMSSPSRKGAFDLTDQQNDVIEYITEIVQELAQMAERSGCIALGGDLRKAILTAHGIGDNSPQAGIVAQSDEAPQRL